MDSYRHRIAVVHVTDKVWFEHFRPQDELTEVDEVNFWRPSAQNRFRAISEGEPFLFRLKAPINMIAGFGFFALQTIVPVPLAWDLFQDRNGDPDYLSFRHRIRDYRARSNRQIDDPLNCLVLRGCVFLPERLWIPWVSQQEWSPNIMTYKKYELDRYPGSLLESLLTVRAVAGVRELEPEYQILEFGERARDLRQVPIRVGQGTFRARLLQVYEHRCAVTGERSLPVLEAAHIQPYQSSASNHIQNGLLLRADVHRLYDTGYLTVTPEHRLEVSGRLRDDFDNGDAYYRLRGEPVRVPESELFKPSRPALRWHNDNVFLG